MTEDIQESKKNVLAFISAYGVSLALSFALVWLFLITCHMSPFLSHCFFYSICSFELYIIFALSSFFFFLHIANQPESKVCVHGYLFPLPVALGQVPHPSYDATAGNTNLQTSEITPNELVTL